MLLEKGKRLDDDFHHRRRLRRSNSATAELIGQLDMTSFFDKMTQASNSDGNVSRME
ncbi:hypothetical protein [Azospirillum doebereinerae]